MLTLLSDILTWYLGSQATYICSLTCLFAEPESFKNQLQSDTHAAAGKGRLSVSEESRAYESKRLTVSSSHLDRTEARISSSAHESRCKLLIHIYTVVPLFLSVSVLFRNILKSYNNTICYSTGEEPLTRVPLDLHLLLSPSWRLYPQKLLLI